MIIDTEEIAGAYVGEEIVCVEHLTDEELDYCLATEIISYDEAHGGEKRYYCDRCNRPL